MAAVVFIFPISSRRCCGIHLFCATKFYSVCSHSAFLVTHRSIRICRADVDIKFIGFDFMRNTYCRDAKRRRRYWYRYNNNMEESSCVWVLLNRYRYVYMSAVCNLPDLALDIVNSTRKFNLFHAIIVKREPLIQYVPEQMSSRILSHTHELKTWMNPAQRGLRRTTGVCFLYPVHLSCHWRRR
jgi:hypothetical protein